MKKIALSIVVAAVLWFLMFSQWTAPLLPFWPTMAVASVILLTIVYFWFPEWKKGPKITLTQVFLGIAIATTMWGVFWIGDKLSSLIFDFARPQVDSIYGMKDGFDKYLLIAQLLLLTGPAEEIFWRGYLQNKLSTLCGANKGFIYVLIAYTLIHIWSFNFMLIMAAMVAGGVWGLLYRLRPQWLPALVVSHAVWDCVVFVIFPI